METITAIPPSDAAWFGIDFGRVLAGVKDLTGASDTIIGSPVITFDPVGPVATNTYVRGTKVLALMSGFVAPGHRVICEVSTAQGQSLTRGFFVPCVAAL